MGWDEVMAQHVGVQVAQDLLSIPKGEQSLVTQRCPLLPRVEDRA